MVSKKDPTRRYGIVTIGVFSLCIVVLVVLNEVKRYTSIKKQQHKLALARQELAQLNARTVSRTADDVVRAQQNALHAEREITDLKSRWKILRFSSSSEQYEKIQQLIEINKQLIDSYEREMQALLQSGMPPENERILFVRTKIAKAQENISDLYRQLSRFSKQARTQEQEKIHQLVAVHKESIATYKQEIAEYVRLGVGTADPKIRFAQEQIAQKNDEIARLEKLL